jgi:hypothetical protein
MNVIWMSISSTDINNHAHSHPTKKTDLFSAFFFFFLKCPPLFIKLLPNHDEICRGPSYPLQVFQSHVP